MPSVAVRVAVERWLGTDGAGGDIFGEPFYALPNGEKGVVYCGRKQTLLAKLQGMKGAASAKGMLGLGSTVVDEVRFIKDEDTGSGGYAPLKRDGGQGGRLGR